LAWKKRGWIMKTRTLSVAALSLALCAGSAFAADLPSRKAPPYIPPPPPPPLWTGFYVGLNAGGTFSDNNSVDTAAAPYFIGPAGGPFTVAGNTARALGAAASATTNLAVNTGGFIGGGQIGYNWQFSSAFVAGLEADIQGVAAGNGTTSAISGAIVGPASSPARQYLTTTSVSKRLDYLGTVRGRLGWLFTPTLLVYGTGGLAYGGVSANTSIFQTALTAGGAPIANLPSFGGSAPFSDTRVGWTAGGGVEWLFLPNWSAKVEYLYYDLGSVTQTFQVAQATTVAGVPVSFANGVTSTTRFNGHVVRAGVNYHFNWGAPAPVVAKY
jgi:outer membrane immunogenic protein